MTNYTLNLETPCQVTVSPSHGDTLLRVPAICNHHDQSSGPVSWEAGSVLALGGFVVVLSVALLSLASPAGSYAGGEWSFGAGWRDSSGSRARGL
ncbi:hypothetical protein EYF80_042158 [Liparis tanakae]|uniref:Uncharacterized protein n=1 Tax=Liparis tanakae TaxID=230148 RepID=A0A4Z2G245_9TELE|nr:hypothetical protein EYF80_042158 [Liparis tanakae]